LTEATFDEMDLIMGSRANIKPLLTINALNTGCGTDIDPDVTSVQDDDKTVIQEDNIDTEGSRRGKKKRKTRINTNELIEALKQKWEDDKEADEILRAEKLEPGGEGKTFGSHGKEYRSFLLHCRILQNYGGKDELVF
jgi:hypothetical protein